MNFSADNTALWNPIIQICILAIMILIANIIRKKVPFIKKSMLPTAVLAGFILLALKLSGLIQIDNIFMETITYHFIAIGFIAMSLRVPEVPDRQEKNHIGLRSGATIVSTYLIQAAAGLLISIGLGVTFMPQLFKASGILLCLGFGQGPGQANNTGSTYETTWGFTGGRSFGLSLAAAGYLCACIVGVIILEILLYKKKIERINHEELSGSVTVDTFQSEKEIPISESIDRLSIQIAIVLSIYLITFLFTKLVTGLLSAYAPGVGNLLNGLLWGFNFIIGSAFAVLTRVGFKQLRRFKLMNHQYQNNYLLSRLSGFAFDIMIVAGIGSIEPEDIKGLWVPFILMVIAGAVVTFFHLSFVCKRIYKDYYYEGLLSMYGMMTGTISSGILLLREIDPNMKTPAANNLVVGSSFAILFGAPVLVLIGLAPQSDLLLGVVVGCCVVYYFILLFFITRKTKTKESA